MKRRAFLGTMTATAAAAGLAACGSDSDSDSADGGGSDGSGKTITLWIMQGTNAKADDYIDKLKKAFNEKTGGTLNVQLQPWDGAHDKFTTAIAGGTTPDVAEVGTTWTPEFADLGALVDVKDRISGDSLDLSQTLIDAATLDGSVYGTPWYAGLRTIMYNKDILSAAGISEPPTSWDGLVDAIGKIKAAGDYIPFPVISSFAHLAPFLWSAGGEFATQSGDTWTSGLDAAPAVEGLDFFTGLALEHESSTPAAATWLETDALAAFEKGNVGMVIQGSWTPATIKQDAPDLYDKVGVALMPGKTDGEPAPAFLGGSHLGIFEASENQDLAWELVKLMAVGNLAGEWATASNYFPGDNALLEEYMNSDDELLKVFAEQMDKASKPTPVTPRWGEVEGAKTITTMVQSILTGKADAATAAKTAADDMNDIFGG